MTRQVTPPEVRTVAPASADDDILRTRERGRARAAVARERPQPDTHDTNIARRRLRLRLTLISLPVALAILVAAGWLLSLSVSAGSGISLYERGSYTVSAQTFEDLLEPALVERWIPYFDRGTALAADEEYVSAIDDFERALPLVPADRKCEVLVNLSLGWERLADGYAEAGYFAGAALLYQNAADVLSGESCTPPDQPVDGRDVGETLEEARARVEAKLGASEGFSSQQDATTPATPEEKLDQLQDQGEGAAEEKTQDDARERAESGPGGFTDKPW